MLLRNDVLVKKAYNVLSGRWLLAIGTFLVYELFVASAGALRMSGSIISLVIAGPFMLGAAIFSLHLARRQEARMEQIFQGFGNFMTAFGAYLLILLFVALWTLLLVVPGIISALSYAMTFYILADEPSLKAADALRRSKAMMLGYKWKLLGLCLRFFLLAIFCVLTLGIGFLWLIPFIHVTMAEFYIDLRSGQAK